VCLIVCDTEICKEREKGRRARPDLGCCATENNTVEKDWIIND